MRSRLLATLVCAGLTLGAASSARAQPIPAAPELSYWAVPGRAGIDVREEPQAPAAIVAILREPTMLQVIDVTTGWMQVRTLDNKMEGWIEPDNKYMLQRSPESAAAAVQAMKGFTPALSAAIQLEVLQMHVRAGFTAAMVTLALGPPSAKTPEDGGKTERWQYADSKVVLTDGAVTRIIAEQ